MQDTERRYNPLTSLTDLAGFMRSVEQVSVVTHEEALCGSVLRARRAEERAEDLTSEPRAVLGGRVWWSGACNNSACKGSKAST